MTPVDDIAVERACSGDHSLRLTPAEAAHAWRQLEQRGLSARQIADTLGVTPRTVFRWRSGETRPHILRRHAQEAS